MLVYIYLLLTVCGLMEETVVNMKLKNGGTVFKTAMAVACNGSME